MRIATTSRGSWDSIVRTYANSGVLRGCEAITKRAAAPQLSPAVDIRQTENEFIIEACVPGFTPDEVEVTFEDGVLNIRGQHTQQAETKGEYVRRERRHTSLFRQVGLPAEVRAEEIRATFTNGVLEVVVPRAQKAQPKRIAVTVGSREQTAPQVIEHTG